MPDIASTTPGTLPTSQQLSGIVQFGATIEGSVRGSISSLQSRVGILEGSSSPWYGKKWACIGTSLTAGASWHTTAAQPHGLTVTNLGVGGGTLTNWQLPSGLMFGGGQLIAQIANIPTDAALVTIEGLCNDWWNGAPLGLYTDRTQGTVYGALWEAYTAIHARAPNALMALLIDHQNNSVTDQEAQDLNSIGLSPHTYMEAMERSARLAGIPTLSFGSLGIGFFNPAAYSDHIHNSGAGIDRIRHGVEQFLWRLKPL
jgi:hypothetical protein